MSNAEIRGLLGQTYKQECSDFHLWFPIPFCSSSLTQLLQVNKTLRTRTAFRSLHDSYHSFTAQPSRSTTSSKLWFELRIVQPLA